MPHKDKDARNAYMKKYYHTHPDYRKAQVENDRLNYWRKKYMKIFYCNVSECKDMTEEQIRKAIKEKL